MNINNFVTQSNLWPGDAIVVKKNGGIFDHYVIYLGKKRWEPLFVTLMAESGVTLLTPSELEKYLPKFNITRLRKFVGNRYQRQAAVERATSLIGKQGYDLFSANCEHFANYVQTGVANSRQVRIAGQIGLILLALAVLRFVLRRKSS